MIPSAKQHLIDTGQSWDNLGDLMADYVTPGDLNEFAIKILKYNLKQYKTQMFQFNTGEASVYKSFDTVTLETIKELENSGSK